jgi:hypothetical protein
MSKKNKPKYLEVAGPVYGPDTSGCSIGCVSVQIRNRAYQLFEARGRQSGLELDDWLQAEREMKKHLRI